MIENLARNSINLQLASTDKTILYFHRDNVISMTFYFSEQRNLTLIRSPISLNSTPHKTWSSHSNSNRKKKLLTIRNYSQLRIRVRRVVRNR